MRKRKPVLLNGEALMADGKVLEFDAVDQEELDGKIDAPQTAAVGEVLTVEEIGEDGKPKKWKTQAVQTEPPDWNENDPTKPGYVKNRTHYKYSDEFLGEIEFTATSEKELILKDQNSTENHDIIDAIGKTALTEHNTTKIIIDGEVCISNAFFSRYVTSLVGEFNYGAGGPAGYSHPAVVNNDNIALVPDHVYAIQFYNVGEYYKPLSEKYLPNTIFSQSNAPVKFGSDDDGNINYNSSVQGDYTKASGSSSHAEGHYTEASGSSSHAEGSYAKASGLSSHAEGNYTEAKAEYSHAEGNFTVASTYSQQVSGRYNIPEDRYREKITPNRTIWISNQSTVFYRSNARTFNTKTGKYSLIDPEKCSFSEITTGMYYIIGNDNSNISMYYLTSLKSVSSGGKTYNCTLYSVVDQEYEYGIYAHIVGNGTSSELSNAYTLDWEGNAWFAGDVYVHSTSGTDKDDGSVRLVTEDLLTSCVRLSIRMKKNGDGTITYFTDVPALFVYYEIFKGRPIDAGNSVECCLIPIESESLTVLNYTGMSIDQNNDGNIVLTVRFSSYTSGKQISAEIKDTISGFGTYNEEILSTVVTVTENAYLPTPTTAQVGQIVRVKSVDEYGKITETETVDIPMQKTLKWITVHSSDLTETKRELIISTDTDGKSIADYNPVGLSLIVSTPADATVESNNGSPWVYPSATKADNAIRAIGSIAGWKTTARDSVFAFYGGSSAMACTGNVNIQLATYKIDGYALDGVRIFFNSANDHLPVGTHVEVAILCEVAE